MIRIALTCSLLFLASLSPAYAAAGGLRPPKRVCTAPGYIPEASLTSLIGPVNPTPGPWHAAQDCPGGVERSVSKNSFLPSSSSGDKGCAQTAGASSIAAQMATEGRATSHRVPSCSQRTSSESRSEFTTNGGPDRS